jgi:hypothetical protein
MRHLQLLFLCPVGIEYREMGADYLTYKYSKSRGPSPRLLILFPCQLPAAEHRPVYVIYRKINMVVVAA